MSGSKYICTGKTKKHHFIVDPPAGTSTVNAKCKYCKFERIHKITALDVMAKGRESMKVKRENAKLKKRGGWR